MNPQMILDFFVQYKTLHFALIFIGSLFEGLSIPCPCMIILIIGGIFLVHSFTDLLWISLVCALLYCIGAMGPYYIGEKVQKWIPKENKYFGLVEKYFLKYGDLSVCVTRPLWIGNLISYFAGMYDMKISKFLAFTFLGIFPWHVWTLVLGLFFGRNFERTLHFAQSYFPLFAVIFAIVVIGLYYFSKFLRKIVIEKSEMRTPADQMPKKNKADTGR